MSKKQFGDFSSYTEINTLAENLFNEGDIESLKAMAKENGIPVDDVAAYLEGETEQLTDAITAAMGKVELEEKEMKPQNIMIDWVEYIKSQIMDNEMIAHQVMKADKSLKGCIGALLKWAFTHQMTIDKAILEAAGVKAGRVTLGMPGAAECKKIIKNYYMGA